MHTSNNIILNILLFFSFIFSVLRLWEEQNSHDNVFVICLYTLIIPVLCISFPFCRPDRLTPMFYVYPCFLLLSLGFLP